ncbi:hypothetical protein [Streptomyces sp. B1I3]|uniref:hypothetical protein n=1 Tax=Streptomyces sp. B1I3 TaxID=3042264 RepID=UPI00278B5823|nr:hypothetical protein [Streptomyces sp. B1I3]MDQ0797049.1 hypothetical protein [Streptomyces sp. B1I3]
MKSFPAARATCATVPGLRAPTGPRAVPATGCEAGRTATGGWRGGFRSEVKTTGPGAPVTGWSLPSAAPGRKVVHGWYADTPTG